MQCLLTRLITRTLRTWSIGGGFALFSFGIGDVAACLDLSGASGSTGKGRPGISNGFGTVGSCGFLPMVSGGVEKDITCRTSSSDSPPDTSPLLERLSAVKNPTLARSEGAWVFNPVWPLSWLLACFLLLRRKCFLRLSYKKYLVNYLIFSLMCTLGSEFEMYTKSKCNHQVTISHTIKNIFTSGNFPNFFNIFPVD